jgi:hypothetical protein
MVNGKPDAPALTLGQDLNPSPVTGKPSLPCIVVGIVEKQEVIRKMIKGSKAHLL